ncbi:helix-turn-helix transcriptional regulator [Amycolatopsis mongoliensis]|uniref:Helix-turn-helix transcriptional regulator n=1 Tax=Amycolatopsis mongoliensis TaxID=715475 RepID=A0A9Y2JXG2_9PSEU|nr:helix-turn-helix transcriptional regulator [Amycolatopsis sp. 4-36]WIY05272.1 helix-turn-helix transcriptional regulator [Amycolatopsis sp. 4-36]
MAPLVATPRSRALGFGLRTAREARGLGVRELARLAQVVAQDLSHWESGMRVPKLEQVGVLLGALRVEPRERDRLLELARNAREPNWLERAMPGVSPASATYAEYERTATAMFDWEPVVVPGLLQAPGYARAILESHRLPPRVVEQQLAIRPRRREVLTGRDPLECTVFLGEAALHQRFGEPPVMIEQFRFLARAAQPRNITIRVVPASVGYHPGLLGHFVIFDFAQLPSVVHIEHIRGSAHVYDGDHLATYRAAAEAMSALALSEQDSLALIQGVIAELE